MEISFENININNLNFDVLIISENMNEYRELSWDRGGSGVDLYISHLLYIDRYTSCPFSSLGGGAVSMYRRVGLGW